MRRFNRRSFERKGRNKEISKDEKLLLENLDGLRIENLKMSMEEIADLVLPDEFMYE